MTYYFHLKSTNYPSENLGVSDRKSFSTVLIEPISMFYKLNFPEEWIHDAPDQENEGNNKHYLGIWEVLMGFFVFNFFVLPSVDLISCHKAEAYLIAKYDVFHECQIRITVI